MCELLQHLCYYTTGKTTVLPLETSALNESKYEDVVQILQYYEDTLKKLHTAASVELTDEDVYHIGNYILFYCSLLLLQKRR